MGLALAAFTAASIVSACGLEHLSSGETMQKLQKIDDMVAQIAAGERVIEQVVRVLGSKMSEQEGVIVVRIGREPFESARVSRFRDDINFSFGLSPGYWRLSDITDQPEAWSAAPRLPDTGRVELYRDWDGDHLTIRCIAGVQNDGPQGERVIQDLRCQISPP